MYIVYAQLLLMHNAECSGSAEAINLWDNCNCKSVISAEQYIFSCLDDKCQQQP